jgi:NAD(P)H-hydrate epimerase
MIYVFCGRGSNGADGLAIAKLLIERGYKVFPYLVAPFELPKPTIYYLIDLQKNTHVFEIHSELEFPSNIHKEAVIIDALIGTGLNRVVEDLLFFTIQSINKTNAYKVSVDIPSGMNADYIIEGTCICADWTITFEQPKIAMMYPSIIDKVGELSITSLGLNERCKSNESTNLYYINESSIVELIQPKPRNIHKYERGVGLLIAGSESMPGAALLSSFSALRSGIGMLYLHTSKTIFHSMFDVIPEVLYVNDIKEWMKNESFSKVSAVAVGPGIEVSEYMTSVIELLLQDNSVSIVFDATAFTLLKQMENWENKIKSHSCILTPHIGEFDRLFGSQPNDEMRLNKAIQKAQELNCVIVLKGPHTAICMPDGRCFFNATGNQGMAKAGSGDVLTGILLSLLSQKYSIEHAALIGVYMHGYAGDQAAKKIGMESMIASDIIHSITDFYRMQK